VRQIGLAVLLAVSLMLAPLASDAQEHKAGKVYRIGVLWSEGSPQLWNPVIEAFRRELWELGYVEGLESRSWNEKKSVPEPSVVLEFRSPEGRPERLPELAAELVRLKVDVILAQSNPAIAAAQKVTTAIPIVMVIAPDPIASGFAASLSWPSGNITGLSAQGPDLPGKALQFLKDAVPNISRVALTMFFDERTSGYRELVADFAKQHKLPTVFGAKEFAEAGGLMSYAADIADGFRRAANYVDKILKGAKPADLPVEQPTKFELVINLRTAKALGLRIPPSILGRADQIIE